MLTKIQYYSEEERLRIIEENNTLFLIEEQNITEGDFLIFSDKPLPENEVIYVNIPQKEFESLKNRTKATEDALVQIMMEGLM